MGKPDGDYCGGSGEEVGNEHREKYRDCGHGYHARHYEYMPHDHGGRDLPESRVEYKHETERYQASYHNAGNNYPYKLADEVLCPAERF